LYNRITYVPANPVMKSFAFHESRVFHNYLGYVGEIGVFSVKKFWPNRFFCCL